MKRPAERDENSDWNRFAIPQFVKLLRSGSVGRGPAIVGIDGRGGSGKSTLAALLSANCTGTVIVHTDDIACSRTFFGWDTLLAKELLEPIRRTGLPFTFRSNHDKPRDIAVSDQTTLLLVEGAGSIRRSLRMLYDATVWVDTAPETARQRLVELGEDPQGYHDDRMIEENSLLNADRPWAHAMFHVSGTNSATNGTVLVRRT